MNYYGQLIRRERLRRNWSQAGLCRGICAVSYLSKIEQGRAEPSDEIVQLLLGKLGLSLDAAARMDAKALADEGFELLFSGDFAGLRAAFCDFDAGRFRAAPEYISLLLLRAFAESGGKPLQSELERCMDARQLALQRILQGRGAEAIGLLPNAYAHFCLGLSEYEAGRYAAALEALQTAYELAAKDGAAQLMLECRALMGSCYCNRKNLPAMQTHYAAARRLARALGRDDMLRAIGYNTAAAQIETGEYEAAYAYFSARQDPDVMALHKLAICCEKTGRKEEALAALDRADAMDAGYPAPELAKQLCSLVRRRLEHPAYLADAAYGELLLSCFERCRAELPAGYASFHLPWVLEWYQATRQYKKACQLLLDFPEHTG